MEPRMMETGCQTHLMSLLWMCRDCKKHPVRVSGGEPVCSFSLPVCLEVVFSRRSSAPNMKQPHAETAPPVPRCSVSLYATIKLQAMTPGGDYQRITIYSPLWDFITWWIRSLWQRTSVLLLLLLGATNMTLTDLTKSLTASDSSAQTAYKLWGIVKLTPLQSCSPRPRGGENKNFARRQHEMNITPIKRGSKFVIYFSLKIVCFFVKRSCRSTFNCWQIWATPSKVMSRETYSNASCSPFVALNTGHHLFRWPAE